MNSPEEEPTDDELADLMDDGASDTSESGDDEGAVEAGIPPALDSDDPELEVDEEAFSIDDFESNLSSTEETDVDENVVSASSGTTHVKFDFRIVSASNSLRDA